MQYIGHSSNKIDIPRWEQRRRKIKQTNLSRVDKSTSYQKKTQSTPSPRLIPLQLFKEITASMRSEMETGSSQTRTVLMWVWAGPSRLIRWLVWAVSRFHGAVYNTTEGIMSKLEFIICISFVLRGKTNAWLMPGRHGRCHFFQQRAHMGPQQGVEDRREKQPLECWVWTFTHNSLSFVQTIRWADVNLNRGAKTH